MLFKASNLSSSSALESALRFLGSSGEELPRLDSARQLVANLGKKILRSNLAKSFPDLMAFGLACVTESRKPPHHSDNLFRRGVGGVFHMSPNNIPMNFAFSMMMGLLSGNRNLVKVPSVAFPQVETLLVIMSSDLPARDSAHLASLVKFVQIGRETPGLDQVVAEADGLVVWGGDNAVAAFRAMPKKPLCREVYFPDRRSSAMLVAQEVLDLSPEKITRLGTNFYNDTFVVDQNACSSPNLIVWIGEQQEVVAAQSRFWEAVDRVCRQRYRTSASVGADKLVDHLDLVAKLDSAVRAERSSNLIWRFQDSAAFNGALRFGKFIERQVSEIDAAPSALVGDEQTLTYFGLPQSQIHSWLGKSSLVVDRVAPVGRALEMGPIWDGKDVATMLSRIILLD